MTDCVNMISFVILSVLLGSAIEGKILHKKARYDGDYEYDEYDAVNENYDATKEVEQTRIPEFVSTAESILINEGDTIKLECIVDKLDNLIMMWKKGNKIIAISDKLYDKRDEERIVIEKVPNGNILSIRLAEEDDAGEYLCQVTAAETIELVHDVQIRVKPKIVSVPQSGLIKVTAGEPIELSCEVIQGYPVPEVLWRRRERPMPTGEDFISAKSIYYPTTNRHHSGIYTCSADNGALETAAAEIKLTVHHPPEIDQNKLFIQNKEENEVEITCTVHASPVAKVTWFKDGKLLEPKNNVISRRGNRHTLLLPGIIEGDKNGSYECRAKNSLGEASASTDVSAVIQPAQFTSASDGTDMTKYVLEWIVISTTEVSECNIRFKVDDDSKDWMYITANVKKDEADTYVGKVTLEHLQPGKKYVVQIASKNADAYNEFSENFKFATKGLPGKELQEDFLSETNNMKDYETEAQSDVKEGSGLKEDTLLPHEDNKNIQNQMELDQGVFLPEDPPKITEDIENEGSGDNGSGAMPKGPISEVSSRDATDNKALGDFNNQLPEQQRSTSGSRKVIFHSILKLGVFCIFLLAY